MKSTKKIILCLSVFTTVYIQSFASQTEDGWKNLSKNDDAGAIQAFVNALMENPDDVSANLGMMYAQSLRLKDDSSWFYFKAALRAAENPHALLYASVDTRRYGRATYDENSKFEQLWLDITEHPDSLGIMQAMGYEHLGMMYEARGDVETSKMWHQKTGAITTWRIIGPFHNISASGHSKQFPPEKVDDPSGVYEGLSGSRVNWFEPKVWRNDSWMDYAAYSPWVTGVFYAIVYAKSDSEQRVQFRLGTSGAFKMFLNDSLVGDTIDECNNDLDTYIHEVTLSEGWNKILIKVDNSELDRCNFLFRITDDRGISVKGLEFSTQPKTYKSQEINARQIVNPFIKYFQQQIEKYPTRIENYLLLAEAYLRNDHVTDAQRVLGQLLKREPDFICALNLLSESYDRSRRTDDYTTTIERISVLRPDLPVSLVYSFYRAITADRIDDAEEILGKMRMSLPRSVDYYDAAIQVARNRNNIKDHNSLTSNAFEDHPDAFRYAAAYIAQMVMTEARFTAAQEIIDRHLNAYYSSSGLALKAGVYRADGNIDMWQKTLMKIIELNPTSSDVYSEMAETYTARKEFEKAIGAMEQALLIAPTNSGFWYTLGNLNRTVGKNAQAIECMKNAIAYNPASFNARETLRELNGDPNPNTLFPIYNVDSLIVNSPGSEHYPEDDAVYLLYDERRVVYDGSRCGITHEMLIRILTKDGIDQFKEVKLPGGTSQMSSVDKAVVRKFNGREIPADVSDGTAVFKGLEEGDFIYIKTSDKVYDGGVLSKYFSFSFIFNAFVPVRIARYALLVPKRESFQYSVSNTVIDPQITDIDSNLLYIWEVKNQPAIEYEDGMPSIYDVGSILHISSVKSWREIVDWYYDIARTKTRSSVEIQEVMDSLIPKNKQFTQRQMIEKVYRYITTNIRYSYVPFRQSGIVPQKARDVLLTRIGDCKDVATLCISMLAERGIPAYHVLVETYTSPLSPKVLPSNNFDHVVVLVELEDGPLFVDLTAQDVPIGSIPNADVDAFSLIIKPGWIISSRLNKSYFTANNVMLSTHVELNPDLSAKITQKYTHTGARTQAHRSRWKTATAKEIEKDLNETLAEDYADAKIDNYELGNMDTLSSSLSYSITFTVNNFTTEAGQFQMVRVPWYMPFYPLAALSYEKRSYAYEFWQGVDTLNEVLTITVPEGYEALARQSSVSYSHAVADYSLTSSTKSDGIHISRKLINKRRFVLPSEYLPYKEFYNNVIRSDRQSLLLAPKGTEVRMPSPRAGGPGR